MMRSILKHARRIGDRFAGDAMVFNGHTLPAKRFRLCGLEFKDDAYYLASAQREVDRLVQHCGATQHSRILDVGCGVGRLATGLISRFGEIDQYQGVDVNPAYIRWCQHHVERYHPRYHFLHLDVSNERYNPQGQALGASFRFPFADGSFDIIYLFSVFSHMDAPDVRIYLREFRRLLRKGAFIFLTAFVEEHVPDVTVNPQDYRHAWQGALHGVRYSRSFFESLVHENDLMIVRFDYEQAEDQQSAVYIKHRGSPS